MNKQFYIKAVIWGFILWFIGYVLGMILFFVVPVYMIGWIIMPIGIIIIFWVLVKKTNGDSFRYYMYLAFIWMFMAILFDYLFIVKALHPVDRYYKLDVYLYYVLTLTIPLLVGVKKKYK